MDVKDVVLPKAMESFYRNFHFAPAVKNGNILYCSGVIGTGPDGKAAADPETQFTHAFEGVKAVLEAGGSSLANIIEMTTFHVEMRKHMGAFAKVKDRFIREPYPAWTAIGISELAFPGGLVEIKVTAKI